MIACICYESERAGGTEKRYDDPSVMLIGHAARIGDMMNANRVKDKKNCHRVE